MIPRENIKGFNEFIEEERIKEYNSLNPFLDIGGVFELRELLFNMKNNDKFIFISDNVNYDCHNDIYQYKDEIFIFKEALDCFRSFEIFNKSKLSIFSFSAVYSIIVYSCVGELKRDLSFDEKNMIYHSDLVPKLTLYQEISSKFNNSLKCNKELFKQMKKLNWNSSADELKKVIYHIFVHIIFELNTSNRFGPKFEFCADYLACCRAFNDNRLEVMPEDVVEAWFLTCNLFLMDLRPYIDGFENLNYIEENSFKSDSIKNNDADNDSIDEESNNSSSFIHKFFGAIISIIIVVVLFLVIVIILLFIFGDPFYNFVHSIRPVGYIFLALAAALAKKIFNKVG